MLHFCYVFVVTEYVARVQTMSLLTYLDLQRGTNHTRDNAACHIDKHNKTLSDSDSDAVTAALSGPDMIIEKFRA